MIENVIPSCSTFRYSLYRKVKHQRTSDSLNEGLPIKMTREKFQRKCYFSMKKIAGSILELSTKAIFSLDKYLLKNMG